MDLGIAGRKAIVCASSRGLGKACARALAEAGCEVVINGRDVKRLDATAAVIANGGFGLLGFGIAIAVLHVAALQLGSAVALSLALMTGVCWNLALWWNGRRRAAQPSKPG